MVFMFSMFFMVFRAWIRPLSSVSPSSVLVVQLTASHSMSKHWHLFWVMFVVAFFVVVFVCRTVFSPSSFRIWHRIGDASPAIGS